ncbi:UNVERIFIED_ORG: hypothetical protein FHR63_001873 [Xanthomonas campestris]
MIEMHSTHVAMAAATFVGLDAVFGAIDAPAIDARNACNDLRDSMRPASHFASFTPASGSR